MAEGQNVGSVNVRLGLDMAAFSAALAQATRQLESFGTRAGRSTQAGAAQMATGFSAIQGHAKATAGSLGEVQTAIGALGAAFAGFQAASFVQGLALTAARTEVLSTVLGQVAKTAGVSTATTRPLVDSMKRLGVTTQEANVTVTKFIQNNLGLDKALKLVRVAQDAAVISGENSSQALNGLLTGIITLQPELLRTRGIIVSYEQSYAAWAAANQRTVESLSGTEKQQIALNAVLQQGTAIQGTYLAAMQDVGKQLTSIARLQEEAANVLGRAYLPALRSTVSGLSGLLTGLTQMDPAWQDLTSGAIASGTSLVALTATAGALAIGIKAAAGAMSGFGLPLIAVTAAISAAIGLWTTYQGAQERATQGTRDLNKELSVAEKFTAGLTAPTETLIGAFRELAAQTTRSAAEDLQLLRIIRTLESRLPGLKDAIAATGGSFKEQVDATRRLTTEVTKQKEEVLALGTGWQQIIEFMGRVAGALPSPGTQALGTLARQARAERDAALKATEELRQRQEFPETMPSAGGIDVGEIKRATAEGLKFQQDLARQTIESTKTANEQRARLDADLAQATGQRQEAELDQRLERQKQQIQAEFAQASQGVADLTALTRDRDRQLAEAENAGAQARQTIQLRTLTETTEAQKRGIQAQLSAVAAAEKDLPRAFPLPTPTTSIEDPQAIAARQKQVKDRAQEEQRLANERAKLEGDLTAITASETAKRTQIETGAVQAQGKLQQTLSEQTQAQLQERTQAWAAYAQTLQELSRAFIDSAASADLFRAATLTQEQAAEVTLSELANRVSALTQARSQLQAQLADPKTLGDPALVTELTTKVQAYGAAITEAQRALLQGQATKAFQDWGTALSRDVDLLGLEVSLAGKSRRERELALDIEQDLQRLRESGPVTPEQTADVTTRLTALSALKEELRGLRDPLQEFLDDAEPMWVQFREAGVEALGTLEDALVDFWTSGKFGFADFAQAIQTDLLRTFTRTLITEPLAQGMKSLFDAIQPAPDQATLDALKATAQGGMTGGLTSALSTATPAIGAFGQELLHAIPSVQAFTAALMTSATPAITETAIGRAPSSTDLGRYTPEITAAAAKTGLDPRLIAAVIQQESGGRATAVSPAGAQGLMQLMPGTSRGLGVTNPLDPGQNIMGGATYLQQLLAQFGTLEKALAAYNAGPGNVQKYGGIPPFQETQAYVPAVQGKFAALGGDVAQPFASALTQATPPVTAFSQALTQTIPSLESFRTALATPTAPSPVAAEIPALGQGGIVTKPTLAWLGERGRAEAVIPLQAGGMVGFMGGLGGLAGGVTGMGLSMLAGYAMNALYGDPAERQANFDQAMKAYQLAFGERTDPRTGHLIIGSSRVEHLPGIDATTRTDWASRVPGAVGYVETPELEKADIMEQMVRMLASLGAMLGGSYLGGQVGGMMGDLGGTFTNPYGTKAWASSARTGMYPGYQAAALGGAFSQATMALLGEAGAEAVVPMRGGAIPARRLGGGLVASLPGGRSIPIRIAAMATGGVVNPLPGATAFSAQASAGNQGASGREGPLVVMHVSTPDAGSFRQSHNQIASQMALALRLAQSRS